MLSEALQAVERANQRLRPNDGACVRQARVAALRSDCDACVEACPRQALSLDPLSVDVGRCDGCRLCVQACPAGALADAPLFQNEVIQAFKATEPHAPFVIACGTAKKPPAGAPWLGVVCLAGIGWELALVPLLLGASRVEFRHGDCTRCSASAEPALGRIQRGLSELRAELALGELVETESPAEAASPRDASQAGRRMSRRGLFSVFESRARATVAEIGSGLGSELDRSVGGALDALWLRTLVARLIQRRPELGRARAVSGLARSPEVSDERCSRCGICATACPSGAIEKSSDRRASLHLISRSHRCLGCERCVEACPERAVQLNGRLDLRAWSKLCPEPLVMERSTGCRICGGSGVLPGLDVCAPCRRANMWSRA